jgi:hypothetical protein
MSQAFNFSEWQSNIDFIVKEHFPHFKWGSKGSSHEKPEYTKIFAQEQYVKERKTYFEDPHETIRMVHFTSLEKLQSIISTRTLRLYNLESMQDPLEFDFFNNIVKTEYGSHKKRMYNNDKGDVHVFCGCHPSFLWQEGQSNEAAHNEFVMWELNGDRGHGVAIEFEITVNSPHFQNIQVKYGEDEMKEFFELNQRLKESQLLEFPNPRFDIDWGAMASAFKHEMYKHEHEIRVVIDNREAQGNVGPIPYQGNIRADFKRNDQLGYQSKYLQFDIVNKGLPSLYHHTKPNIYITKLILGHRVQEEAAQHFINTCKEAGIKLKEVDYTNLIEMVGG